MTIPGSFVTSSSTEPPPAAAHPPLRMHRLAEKTESNVTKDDHLFSLVTFAPTERELTA